MKVIIDTDPGQDDAVAILTALGSPELEVMGLTTVAGNVPLSLTTNNALALCELAGRPDLPVHAGESQPLERALVTAEYVHGATGIDGAGLGPPTGGPASTDAVGWLIETVMSQPGEITLCTLGPLTNVATAMIRERRLSEALQAIVMMGGGFFEGGNVTPAAEFNIYVDPEAAAIVFRSGVPLTVMPLDVTHQALVDGRVVDRFRAMGTPVGDSVAGMLEFFDRYDAEKYGTSGAPLHDPCVIAHLLDPQLFVGRAINVEIELGSDLTAGMTVADWWGVSGRPANCTWMRSVDRDRFFDLIVDRIGRL